MEVFALIPYPSTGALYEPESDVGTLGTAWNFFVVEATDVDDGRDRVVTLLRRLAAGEFTLDRFAQIKDKAIKKTQPDSADHKEAKPKKSKDNKKRTIFMVSAWVFPPLTVEMPHSHTDRQTDKRTNRQIDRHTDIHTDTHISLECKKVVGILFLNFF